MLSCFGMLLHESLVAAGYGSRGPHFVQTYRKNLIYFHLNNLHVKVWKIRAKIGKIETDN